MPTPYAAPPVTGPAGPTPAKPTAAPFGTAPDGTAVHLYTLTNQHGMRATSSTYGGTVTSLHVPAKNGQLGNVVLGYNKLADYVKDSPAFGALVGRYGNRIAKGKFAPDGMQYQVPVNNGANALHGGVRGFDKRTWVATPGFTALGPALTLSHLSKDSEEGYPGNLQVRVVYTLTHDNALRLAYTATTDKDTVLTLTNHSYLNLNYGHGQDILDHVLTLNAERFTPVDAPQVPTGELQPVAGTPFDFRRPCPIGERLGRVPGGYDHNYVLAAEQRPRPALAATV